MPLFKPIKRQNLKKTASVTNNVETMIIKMKIARIKESIDVAEECVTKNCNA